MVVDFKALKLAVEGFIGQFDHTMAVNSQDPLRASMEQVYPGSLVVFENQDPTTEVIAKFIFDFIDDVLKTGYQGESKSGTSYKIPPGSVLLERVRVWETPSSWAEYGD